MHRLDRHGSLGSGQRRVADEHTSEHYGHKQRESEQHARAESAPRGTPLGGARLGARLLGRHREVLADGAVVVRPLERLSREVHRAPRRGRRVVNSHPAHRHRQRHAGGLLGSVVRRVASAERAHVAVPVAGRATRCQERGEDDHRVEEGGADGAEHEDPELSEEDDRGGEEKGTRACSRGGACDDGDAERRDGAQRAPIPVGPVEPSPVHVGDGEVDSVVDREANQDRDEHSDQP
eukprot:scaffold48753_cov29-Tisochrysis_lutea.AAC.3